MQSVVLLGTCGAWPILCRRKGIYASPDPVALQIDYEQTVDLRGLTASASVYDVIFLPEQRLHTLALAPTVKYF